ncbi:hypothetical protein IGI04_011432 [Brassica rapa subsp. trilocularis]|uniref:TPX2 C-terminal domain-containing protein n=1 Tax=Brassica rapa subsp. trilocularis TaxID=1813537 RepID=A0ABQ7N3U7_BRACM|nr:hypothetical protein IGI04_011432 [Brassica rapa subsp. trilocularis]
MESKNAKPETLPMDPIRFQSDAQVVSVSSENSNPNVSRARIVESPSSKSSESAQKVTRSKLNPSQTAFSPRNRIRERRFVVVKKKEDDSASVVAGVDCKCGAKNMKKCVCVAYETLRASHEEFFKKRGDSEVSSQNVEEEDEIDSLDSSASMGSRISKKKQVKVTSLKPFKLRTEERGRMKEEELAKKIQEMTMENEKMRIPIAQGLPWTTDEPESLVKPHVKGITTPVDLKLHSDIRAMERAEFDYQVAEKMSLIEQYKAERKEQQLVAEEEELRRLRKELIPKAQPMPYFDRPFIPRRSSKHPTIPRDPKFHKTQHKRCCSTSSWSETGSYMSDIFYQQDL